MKFSVSFIAAAAAIFSAAEAKDGRTFAVLRFLGKELTRCRQDPVVDPGSVSAHLHSVMGGNAFAMNMPGNTAEQSTCTNAKIKNDHSNYWIPSMYFHAANGSFIPVEMFYMNVYYFFEGTNDQIQAFPEGFRMVSGSAALRAPPAGGYSNNRDPSKGPVVPAGFTCPRSDASIAKYGPLYPANSDGTKGVGIGNPNNRGEGIGFPDKQCDGYASPLRADIHFPSCYNPAAGPENFKENTAFPTSVSNGKQDCPPGWIHLPHLFFEVYWNTPAFNALWEQGQGHQPFVLSNGDATGYSLHGDFINGWTGNTLQTIINTCDAGDAGMQNCPNIPGGLTDQTLGQNCKVTCPIGSEAAMDKPYMPIPALFGNNPVTGYQAAPYSPPASGGSGTTSVVAAPKPSTTTKAASKPATTMYVSTTTKKVATTTKKTTTKSTKPAQTTRRHHHTKAARTTAVVKPAEATSTCTARPRQRKHSRHGHRHHAHGSN